MATILILGATSDMAAAMARKFASEGNHIILAGRNETALKPLQADLNIRYGVDVYTATFNAADFGGHNDFFRNLHAFPDCIACFFGYLGDQETAESDWVEANSIISANYTGAVSLLNIAAELMIKKGKGSIIGISSVAGDRGRMSNYIYGSAKSGFTAYLSGLRNRLFHNGIHVMTVKPGFVATKMTEDLDLPKLLTGSAEQAAGDIYKGWLAKRNVIYTRWFWRYIMLIICCIPEFMFKKLKM